MEGLWGTPSAISQFFPGKVTSQSLGQFLLTEVPKRAESYKRKLNPTVQPLFPLGSDVYFGDQQPPPNPPEFDPWPDPKLVLGMGPQATATEKPDLGSLLGGLLSDGAELTRSAVTSTTEWSHIAGGLAGWGVRGAHRKAQEDTPHQPDPGEALRKRIQSQEIPQHFETGAGFAMEGAKISAIWTLTGSTAGVAGRADWWHVGGSAIQGLQDPTPTLIELTNGLFLALTALPHFIGSVVCNDRGAEALVYRELYTQKSTGDLVASAIAQMESGSLRSDSIADLVVELRQSKHVDPTLGVISAYLYDSIGDVESIRRMAFHYIQHHQAIPYDIALLAQVEGRRNAKGLLQVDIPDVMVREPRTQKERQFLWTWEHTPASTGIVAGFWPWMRQGWTFLEDSTEAEFGLVRPGITALRSQLTSARFATLTQQGGRELVHVFGMHRFSPHL
jgi:hypothetical protein